MGFSNQRCRLSLLPLLTIATDRQGKAGALLSSWMSPNTQLHQWELGVALCRECRGILGRCWDTPTSLKLRVIVATRCRRDERCIRALCGICFQVWLVGCSGTLWEQHLHRGVCTCVKQQLECGENETRITSWKGINKIFRKEVKLEVISFLLLRFWIFAKEMSERIYFCLGMLWM